MTETEETRPVESFQCSHCVTSGEISFSSFQKQQSHSSAKVWVNNLPECISESGLKNLFLTVGKPLSISYNPRNKSALVEFNLLNEAELAVRDLHCKPPYHLKVKLFTPNCLRVTDKEKEKENQSAVDDVWDFSQNESKAAVECEIKEESREVNSIENPIINVMSNLYYDPSVRIKQKKLDFKTGSGCVSLGRGYMYRGNINCNIGGLQKFESSSENSKAKNEMNFFCGNCKALTTKICGSCSASYCSKICLNNHHTDCNNVSINNKGSQVKPANFQLSNNSFSQVPLVSNCTVVITTYLTMRTIYVRRSDEHWDEKFSRLCNDVAAEAFKGLKLKEPPKVGDLVIAKYNEDFCYYRGKVISQCDNKINLSFIDFGNLQETNVEDLIPLPEYLKSVPAFAVKVHLKGVSNESSFDSVDYFNKLTAEGILLTLRFDESTREVVLTEKDSKVEVNETVVNLALPSWKKDKSVLSKSGEVLKLDSIERQKLEIGKTLDLIVSHFDETEFLESEVFWVVNPKTDEYFHASSQMRLQMREYCEYLKNDFYLPRENELCLAKEEGEWQRCVNLKSHKTTCCLFFIDDGHSSLITTGNIRKMIPDFIQTPAQAVCCTLPENSNLKTDKELQSNVVKFLKESAGETIKSVSVLKLMGDAYCLLVPEINNLFI